MALIIEGIEMPKACWQFRYGEERYVCPLYESCKKKSPYDMDFRPSDCPIKGEIPDKHGELVDRDFIITNGLSLRDAPTVVESTEYLPHGGFCNRDCKGE